MFETKFYRFCNKAVTVIRYITGFFMLCMLLVVVTQVVMRGILSLPTPWTEEVSTYLVTYITFIGGIAVMIRAEHLAIDLVTEHVSPAIRKLFQVLYSLIFILVCTYLAVYGAELCLNPLIYKQLSIATQIPRVIIYAIMPISMILCDIYCIINLFFVIRHMIRKDDVDVRSLAKVQEAKDHPAREDEPVVVSLD